MVTYDLKMSKVEVLDKFVRVFHTPDEPNLLEAQAAAGLCKVNKRTTKAQRNRYERLIESNVSKEEVISLEGGTIFEKDMYVLRDKEELNDQCINFYLKLLVKSTQSHWNTIHLFPTNFFQCFQRTTTKSVKIGSLKLDYFQVRRYTHRFFEGITHRRLLLFPINVPGHWVLVAVHTRVVGKQVKHDVKFYDSFNMGSVHNHKEAVKYFLQQEYEDKPKRNKRTNHTTTYRLMDVTCPEQTNSYDCGVHLCANAFSVCHNLPIDTFQKRNMRFFRVHMANSIAAGTLLPLVSYPEVPTKEWPSV